MQNKYFRIAVVFFALILISGIIKYPSYSKWYDKFTLQNGMEVIVIPNHKIPAVSQMIWYHVGSKDEVRGKSGLAHFLEHLMFKGTQKYPDGKFSQIIAENAGEENAMTSHDFTAYFQKIEKSKLPLVMELEADRMKNLQLTPQQVASENKVILEERRMRYDNSPRMLLLEKMDNNLFGGTPYEIQPIGWENEMRGLTREDALEFYKKYYAPNNATLIIAGDVEPNEVKKLAKKYYGNLPRGEEIKHQEMAFPSIKSNNVELADSRVKQPELWVKYQAPSFVYANPELTFPLIILSRIIGEGTTSRLYQSLVVEQKLAVAVGSQYDGFKFGATDFTFYVLPAVGVSTKKLSEAIAAEIEKITKNGIKTAEIESAKKAIIAEMTYSREGLQGMSFITGQAVAIGLDPQFITNLPTKISAVSKQQVDEAASLVLVKQRSVTGILKGK